MSKPTFEGAVPMDDPWAVYVRPEDRVIHADPKPCGFCGVECPPPGKCECFFPPAGPHEPDGVLCDECTRVAVWLAFLLCDGESFTIEELINLARGENVREVVIIDEDGVGNCPLGHPVKVEWDEERIDRLRLVAAKQWGIR